MKRLFFVRHGETELNEAGLISGRKETPLTPKGVSQAVEVGKQIKQELPNIDLIISSPLERTYETAKLIARGIGYPIDNILKSELFIERTFGILDGTSGKDFFKQHEYKDFDDVKGAETIEALQKRATKAFEYINHFSFDNILIVGHSAFGRALRRVVNKLPYSDEYETFDRISNAGIVELV